MKRLFPGALFLYLAFSSVGVARAQCSQPTVTSFSLAPNVIAGDGSEIAMGTVQACVPDSMTNFYLDTQPSYFNWQGLNCGNGQASGEPGICSYLGVGSGNITVTFGYPAINGGPGNQNGTISVNAYTYPTPVLTQPVTVTPMADPYEPPPQDPDGPCPDGCGGAGSPINVMNGNTWIPQQDYRMPGIGGGFTLTRTWNSLWANMNPPSESGIFGDSWRSNIEERIQVLTGGVVKYWKGNGSSLFYAYSGAGGAYYITAPLDDQTTLSYNSTTTLWTAIQKDGTQRIFNSAGYLTSIVDLNGNTTTVTVDAAHQNRIASVTDASGHLLTFNYSNANFPGLCTSITDAVGTFTQYVYDSSGRLTQVQYPDGSQYNFQFNDPNSPTLISLITDLEGKTIEAHTYDSLRRGLASQQANDSNGIPVNKVTIVYGYQNPWDNYVCDAAQNNCAKVQVSNRGQRHYISQTSGGAS